MAAEPQVEPIVSWESLCAGIPVSPRPMTLHGVPVTIRKHALNAAPPAEYIDRTRLVIEPTGTVTGTVPKAAVTVHLAYDMAAFVITLFNPANSDTATAVTHLTLLEIRNGVDPRTNAKLLRLILDKVTPEMVQELAHGR